MENDTEHAGNVGDITDHSARAALRVRWTLEAQRDLDRLIYERRAITTGNAIDINRLLRQLSEADTVFGLSTRRLPRGYAYVADSRRKLGFYLRFNGKEVLADQFALDIATGWIEEVNALLDRLLQEVRPKAIAAKFPQEVSR